VVGQNYYVYVAGFSDNSGNFDLTLTCELNADIAESCATTYLAYTPLACADITVEATYGAAPYTYNWSNGDTGATINVCPEENTTYQVTVTDANGDTASAESTVVVVNNFCGNKDEKVGICHTTGDGEFHNICVAESAVEAHLAHGDSLGFCGETYTCDTAPDCTVADAPVNGAVDLDNEDVTISWSTAAGLVDGYLVSIGTTSGGTDVADNADAGDALSYDAGTLDYATTYYVTITAYNGNGNAQGCSETSFTTEQSPWCGADALECDSVKNGSTAGADAQDLGTCGTSLNGTPGDFYSFIGTGDVVSMTTCSANTTYDTKLGVFSGDCAAITCVAGDDDDSCVHSNLHSKVEFNSVAGETYYIFVSGFSGQSGDYELTTICSDPPADAPLTENVVDCGAGAANYSYCYDSNDLFSWLFSSSDGSAIELTFNSGSIEDNTFSGGTYDDLVVYDGTDATGTLLYDSDVVGDSDLTGLSLTGNSGSLFVTFDSDFSVSCDSGTENNWDFDVSCAVAPLADDNFATLNSLEWSMYPNPARGLVNLGLENFVGQNVSVSVQSLTNRSILSHNIGKVKTPSVALNLSSVPPGVYFVKITTDQGQFVKQLIKR
jgi:hypothetical protein